jgi:acyl-CoA hydrolase
MGRRRTARPVPERTRSVPLIAIAHPDHRDRLGVETTTFGYP